MEFLFAPPGSIGPAMLALLFGLMIGSFLNVLIHRMPRMWQREFDNYVVDQLNHLKPDSALQGLRQDCSHCGQPASKEALPLPHTDRYDWIVPRSACPHCGHKITPLENIPVISWLFLRGKCSACKAPISVRYPAVELLTGLLAALLAWRFGTGWYGLGALLFLFLLIPITFIDIDIKEIPDDLSYLLLWSGLLINMITGLVSLPNAVLGAVIGYMSLWTVNYLFELILKKQGMGNGDFKLLAALGAWFGWQSLIPIILMSSVVGIFGFVIANLIDRRPDKGQMPFGPYLAAAGLIYMLYRPAILNLLSM
ncbi:A24 family peptidase [Massilia sp. W12]|uniref:A24 family peptidase n=1 Tax=Massilia sp. W12 TaxID=3126507 RepID=UPI0030CEC4D0